MLCGVNGRCKLSIALLKFILYIHNLIFRVFLRYCVKRPKSKVLRFIFAMKTNRIQLSLVLCLNVKKLNSMRFKVDLYGGRNQMTKDNAVRELIFGESYAVVQGWDSFFLRSDHGTHIVKAYNGLPSEASMQVPQIDIWEASFPNRCQYRLIVSRGRYSIW